MSKTIYETIFPGETLAVLGGGQLGRMFTQSAQAMGYRVLVLDPEKNCPTAQITPLVTTADYDDPLALATIGSKAKAVTTEFENVPATSLQILSKTCQVSPMASAVAVSQDRIAEKAFIEAMGVPVAPYAAIHDEGELKEAIKTNPQLLPGILKLARNGYDGKGQARVKTLEEALEAFKNFDLEPCVLEAMLPLAKEISMLVVRGFDGQTVTYPIAENVHVNGILATTYVNPQDNQELLEPAQKAVLSIAEGLNYVGVLCVEFFVLEDGRLIANEMAPRPHNSGHYTQNACVTSQFEQQVRAMTYMPLGSAELLAPAVMLNILGDTWLASDHHPKWQEILALPGVSLHLYGKEEARKGRKMGHVNIVGQDFSQVRLIAQKVAKILHLSHIP
ncbi:5-(carboxyamino)imidazole ribonucleotide synthase [Basilea psittacipulmonis]|uniref:N5-carboxyaminoimidazole ribonucleotide synthase n=1 Tax=Basilea psittacipulmonis DSM 24701 TaxID=1072685 RepID=A0A077DCC1_9BURK|nr:5-(carboxyamino)imidazole ribonucleotide synthase [Basilea psittacipulmonis]AIL32259.1 phosphoribosylaminoimidazole carboxylase [Basilea psittacipulmonis DSM 24701]